MGLFSKIFDDILGFDPPKAPPPPPLPIPEPEKIKADEEDEIRKRRLARASGLRRTIVTGDLSPDDPTKVNLLGRTR
jgi:hypothetical protein